MKTIEDGWKEFSQVISKAATSNQRNDMKLCFYSGIVCFLSTIKEIADSPEATEDDLAQSLEKYSQEACETILEISAGLGK